MKRCCLHPGLVAFALLALFNSARASTVIAPDFDDLVGTSDYIVRVVVKSVTSDWRENPSQPDRRSIGTLVDLDVKEVIKGNPPSPLELDLVGGRVGDVELIVDGAPKFIVGQESILFVKGNGRRIIPLVGMWHGYYPVRRDQRTKEDQVMRSSGKFLYNEKEVALPVAALSDAPARDPSARPLNSTEFADRIRKSKNFSHHDQLD